MRGAISTMFHRPSLHCATHATVIDEPFHGGGSSGESVPQVVTRVAQYLTHNLASKKTFVRETRPSFYALASTIYSLLQFSYINGYFFTSRNSTDQVNYQLIPQLQPLPQDDSLIRYHLFGQNVF